MAKSKRGFWKLRKAWRRITPLRNYVAMTVRPVSEVNVHHTVTQMPPEYFEALEREKVQRKKAEASPKGPERRQHKQKARRWRKVARLLEKAHMRYLEEIALGRGFSGISYTNIIFPSGRVWKGRGFKYVGAHTGGRNSISYGLAAVGNYEIAEPTEELLQGFARTIAKGVRWKRIRKDAKIQGHRDTSSTACPGRNLYKKIDQIRKIVRQVLRKPMGGK